MHGDYSLSFMLIQIPLTTVFSVCQQVVCQFAIMQMAAVVDNHLNE